MDKIRARRELLKQAFFNMDCSKIPIRKEITVDLRYIKNKYWPGYGYVTIMSDGPDGYSHFSTHQEHPLQYAKDRMKEEQYKDYKLIVK